MIAMGIASQISRGRRARVQGSWLDRQSQFNKAQRTLARLLRCPAGAQSIEMKAPASEMPAMNFGGTPAGADRVLMAGP